MSLGEWLKLRLLKDKLCISEMTGLPIQLVYMALYSPIE